MSCAQPPPEITLLLKTTASGNLTGGSSQVVYAHVLRSDTGHSTWAKSAGCSESLPQCLTAASELFQKSDGRRHNKPAVSVTLCSKWAWEKTCTSCTVTKKKSPAGFTFLTQSTKTRFRRRAWQCTRIACGTSALNLDTAGNAGPDQATQAACSMLHQPRVSMVAVESHLASYPLVGEKCRNSSTTFSSFM